ncbi:androgen-dependent TFPI-regulating protein-like [Arctopsyche grandis]|uniref:androgen-dependent TFPI-regulating protein-like n=1 Tax=Arctopsyche grandis TaxID=121162 RepID=UPI00406D9698
MSQTTASFVKEKFEKRMWLKMRTLFHGIALFHHISALVLIETSLDITKGNINSTKDINDFKILFFSSWNFAIQMIFLMMAFICDIVKTKTQNGSKVNVSYETMSKLASIRDFIFTTFVFPLSIFVGTCFWATYHIDRELVMPKEWDLVVPSYMNHAIHTNIIPIVILEMIIATKKVPNNHTKSLFCLGSITIVYFACFLCTYFVTGRWIYVLFKMFNWTQRMLSFIVIYGSVHIFYYMGWFANNKIENLRKNKHARNDFDEKGFFRMKQN